MKDDPDREFQKNELRRLAEESLIARGRRQIIPPAQGELSEQELLHLIHELQVHQVELELQNEALQIAQAELSASRDRYFDLFDLAPVGYFMLDEDMVIRAVNLAGAELLSAPRSALRGRALSGFVYEKDQDAFFLFSEQARQDPGPVNKELRLVKADGSPFYAHLNCVRVEQPGEQGGELRLVMRDINERVVLGHELAKNEAILSGAERLAHVGGWEWDGESGEVTLSAELQRIYGVDRSAFSLADFLKLAHPADQTAKRAAIETALAGAGHFRCEFRILRPNDHAERYLLASGEVVFKTAGAAGPGIPVKIYGATQDVTELKQNERGLILYAARLEVMNRDLESFTYVASHDLQEPLRKIMKFGDLVKSHPAPQLDEETKDYIVRMQNAAARMQSLIADLLTYARVANGTVSFQNVDLNQTLVEVMEELERPVEKNNAQVDISALPTIYAEPVLMKQLFLNLIGNALKFHGPESPPVVKVAATLLPSNRVEIRVIDQGIGFDEHELERIFRPFERLHTRSEFEGSGIGLAICRRIVERHSGSITASSKPGEGATFTVTLPLSPV